MFSETESGQMVVKSRPIAPGRMQAEFEVLGKLGEGTFGEAFRVRKEGQLYAIKRAKEAYQGHRDREARLQEVWRAMRVQSRHCVRVIEAWEEAGVLHIQSELCERGNLNDVLTSDLPQAEWWQTVPEEQIWRYLLEMARSLKHVHECGMVHLDVKPSNFFVRADGSLALGDFGQAVDLRSLSRLRDDDVEGDSVYMAPELL